MNKTDNKDIITFFFYPTSDRKDCHEYWCKIYKERDCHREKPYASPKGYQNLFNHIQSEAHANEWNDLWKAGK